MTLVKLSKTLISGGFWRLEERFSKDTNSYKFNFFTPEPKKKVYSSLIDMCVCLSVELTEELNQILIFVRIKMQSFMYFIEWCLVKII